MDWMSYALPSLDIMLYLSVIHVVRAAYHTFYFRVLPFPDSVRLNERSKQRYPIIGRFHLHRRPGSYEEDISDVIF